MKLVILAATAFALVATPLLPVDGAAGTIPVRRSSLIPAR
jgi:hypothetical protein